MNVGIFFVAIALPPTGPGQSEATRPPEPIELPVEILLEAEPEHLRECEAADAMDRVALVVPHRAHTAVGAQVADLGVDRVGISGEGRVGRREEPAFVDRFRVGFAGFLRVLRRLEFREIDQEELPEPFLFDGAQEEGRVSERLRGAEHPVDEEVWQPLKPFLSRWHDTPPWTARSSGTVPQDRLDLLRRAFHRKEHESQVRVVVHEGDEERLFPGAEAQELAFVGLDDRANESPLGQLDRRHLRRADDRGGHRRHHLRVDPIREGVGHDEAIPPHDRGRLDVRHTGQLIDRLLEARPDVGHAGTSAPLRISVIDWTALSTLSSRRPMFASFRTIVTRIASSPAPVAIIFPIWVSTIDELNDPRPISTTAISDVPTIAAAIAAIFFGSIVFGSACAIRIPSRRAIVAPSTAGNPRNSMRISWSRWAAPPSICSPPRSSPRATASRPERPCSPWRPS